jgi:hypothetical protein
MRPLTLRPREHSECDVSVTTVDEENKEQIMAEKQLDQVIAEHIAAVNAFDTDAIVATCVEDAFVNDARREFRGIDAIRAWAEREMVGDKVTIDVREVVDNYGDTIVRGAYDGDYDKTNLPPGELIMSNYFGVRDGKITSLIVIRNQPAVLK